MKRKPLPVLVFCLVLLSAAPTLADGDIYVGGPWGTKITSLPYEIKTPGAYYLGINLSYTGAVGGDGITIDAGVNHVTLDLMGFTLNGSGSGRYGIYLNGSKNVEIRNGTVTGWSYGIREENFTAMLHRIINVRVVGNETGIYLLGEGHLVKGCKVEANGPNSAISISRGMVSGCTVTLVDGTGIIVYGGIVSNNVLVGTGAGSLRSGISSVYGGILIKGNKVSGCAYGIHDAGGEGGLNVIGNTVDTPSSTTTGVYLIDNYDTLLDQNSVTGAGIHYNAAYTKVSRRSNY